MYPPSYRYKMQLNLRNNNNFLRLEFEAEYDLLFITFIFYVGAIIGENGGKNDDTNKEEHIFKCIKIEILI